MPLSRDQQGYVARAREILDEKRHEYDPEAMAAHIGKLDYWLREMIRLVEELSAPEATVTRLERKYGG